MSADFGVPRTWKADAAYQRRLGTRAALGVALQYARLTSLYHYYDRNLAAPAFTLADERGRAVFVPPTRSRAPTRRAPARARASPGPTPTSRACSSSAATGAATSAPPWWTARSGSGATASCRGRTPTTARATTPSYNCCIAVSASFTPVASDPRDLSGSWGPSNTDFRHKVAAFGSLPSWRGVRLSARYVGLSGTPFSAMVAGDVNGDDPNNNNDLAMVFDPDAPGVDPAVAAAMRRVLANPDNVARDYLRANLGRVARRNGAANPFFGRLDLRLSSRVPALRGQRVELTADVFNVANLVDRDRGRSGSCRRPTRRSSRCAASTRPGPTGRATYTT
jgi:hypothetical protein